jgi:hypothetical protein
LNLEKTCHIGPGLLNELVVVVIIDNLLIRIELSEEADPLNHVWRVLQLLWWLVVIDGHLNWCGDHYLRRRNCYRWNNLLLHQHLLSRRIRSNILLGLTASSGRTIIDMRRCIRRLALLCRIAGLLRHYHLLLLRSHGLLLVPTTI